MPSLLAALWFGGLLFLGSAPARAVHTDTDIVGSTFSWLGNSFVGGNSFLHVSDYLDDCYVTKSGRMYTIGYDEGQSNGSFYDTNGQVYRMGNYVGCGITADETERYVYLGGAPTSPSGISVCDAQWQNYAGAWVPLRSILIGVDCSRGIAARNGEVYISDNTNNQIRVWNRDLTRELRTFPFTRPGKITVDAAGNLWIIQRAGAGVGQYALVRCVTKTGTFVREINDQHVVPTGLAIDNNGYLLVCDDSVHQQIRFYKNIQTTPVLDHTFGVDGGIYASTGNFRRGMYGDATTPRLHGPVGVGMDAAGNLYVANGGGGYAVNVMSYAPSGKLRWWRYGLQDFVDTSVQDQSSELDVYTTDDHHKMNWKKALGQEATPYSFTADRFNYPSDMRLNTFYGGDMDSVGSPTVLGVKTIAGHQLMLAMSGASHDLWIFRRGTAADGEMWVPCAWVCFSCMIKDTTAYPPHRPIIPDNGTTIVPERWIWTDTNGNGAFDAGEYEQIPELGIINFQFDDQGDIWVANGAQNHLLQRMPLQGFTASGAPRYTGATIQDIPLPGTLQLVNNLCYTPSTGIMYLLGSTNRYRTQGTHLVKLTNWNNPPGTNYQQIAWQSDEIPSWKPTASSHQLISVAGDFIFSAYLMQSWPDVYRASDGSYVGTLPVPANLQPVGWLDQKQGMHAYRRANGEYDIYVEEDIFNKTCLFRWAPVKVVLTSLKDGGRYTAGSNISLAATTTANDGAITNVKFYNGASLLATATTSPYRYTWRAVAAGTYTVSAVVTDAHGNTSTDKATITVSSAAGTGLLAQYYNGASFPTDPNTVPALTRTDANVNFQWGAGAPGAGVNTEHFLVRWTGYIQPTTTGTYTFYTDGDGGARLWVNGQPISNDWTTNTTHRSGAISLTANQFAKIEMEYYQSTGVASAVLSWSAAGVTKAVIPQRALFPPTGAFDIAPAVTLTGVTANQRSYTGVPLALAAAVNDLDGAITRVEFFQGATLLGTDSEGLDGWSYTWANPATGAYALTARAYDNGGNSTRSEPIPIKVTAVPTVTTAAKNTVTSSDATTLLYYDFEDGVNPCQGFWAGGAQSPGAVAAVPSATNGANKAWTFGPIGANLPYTVTSGSAASDLLSATNVRDMKSSTMWQSGDNYLTNIPANARYLACDLGASTTVSTVRVLNGWRDNSVNGRRTAHFDLYVDDIAPGGTHTNPVLRNVPLLNNDDSDSSYLTVNKTGRYVTIMPIDVWDDDGTVKALATARFSLSDVRITAQKDFMGGLKWDSTNNLFAQEVLKGLNQAVGTTPKQFRISYKMKRLTACDADSQGSIQLAQLEPILKDAHDNWVSPPTIPEMSPYLTMGWGFLPTYYTATLGGVSWATMDPGVYDGMLFTVTPKGAGSYKQAILQLEFVLSGGGVATESFAIDDLRIEEIIPAPAAVR